MTGRLGAASLAALLGAIDPAVGDLIAQEPTLTNVIGMEFVLVSPGTMVVGRFQPVCPGRDAAVRREGRWTVADFARCEQMADRDATPGFTVAVAQPYYIGRYEVTQAEWKRVMGSNPSIFQGVNVRGNSDRHPVDNVSWSEAQAFVTRLNALDTTAVYRLPTEFEWEYAARAGTSIEPSWDDIRTSAWQGDVDLGTTHPVGTKRPNAWGLHDTLGNVWEWVGDIYNEKLFSDSVPPTIGSIHVLKGGSFVSDVKNTTWSTHAGGPGSGFDVGFRLLREVRPRRSNPDAGQ